jgi:soluble lytic murein transglycosylase
VALAALGGAAVCAQAPSNAPARLAAGIQAYERKDYRNAIAALKGLDARLPKLADYSAYYLSAAEVESKTKSDVTQEIAPVWSAPVASPYAGKAAIVAATGLIAAGKPAEAVQILVQHYEALPQPDGDLAQATAYEAAGDLPHAARFYQQVYYRYPASDAATKAAAAIPGLREHLGPAWPAVAPQTLLDRAAKLMDARENVRARAEYQSILPQLSAADQDLARVRMGAADYRRGQVASACQYLRDLKVAESEADAERLYYVAECAGRSNDESARLDAVRHLNQQHEHSPARFKALLSLAGHYLLENRVDDYEPLYAMLGQSFPNEPKAAAAHWKYVWAGYIRHKPDAAGRLREHLHLFAGQSTAGSALYFLGRLAEDSRDYASARAYYDKLAERLPNYYYGLLGMKRLADPNVAAAQPAAAAKEFLAGLAFPANRYPGKLEPTAETQARIERAHLLRTAGLDDLADRELRFGARDGSQSVLLAIDMARAANSAHLGLRAMKSLVPDSLAMPIDTAPKDFWQLLFPLPYKDDVLSNAKTHALDPCMVAALIRQESEFNPRALSPAKAYGLTQVMPLTGRSLARKSGMRTFSSGMLYQPSTNLRLGTLYLRMLLDEFAGEWEQTLAAYNAGKTRVAKWQTWGTFREPAEFVESIPFTETHDYVQAVLRNAELYRRIYGERIKQ